MHYRADIDGLRAVAVTAVVGFHIGAPGFASGFVGVDVFFVISGFLITTLLLREQQATGRIDIAAFYARRVRRLLPALCLMLACTTVAAFFVLTSGGEQQWFAKSAASTSAFLSNVYFGLVRHGYFTEQAQYLPLLHTWSLGIEEQFYIVWPAVMIVIGALSHRWKLPLAATTAVALALGSAVSLGLCLVLLAPSESAAFFLFPTRAWELGAGALLALAPLKQGSRPRLGSILAGLAGAVIIGIIVLYPAAHVFTVIPSMIAVAAAALLLAGNALGPAGLMARALSVRPVVVIGKLSYSWYLWHWPLLSFSRNMALGEPSFARDAAVALLALPLAALTWRFIEQPVREKRVRLFASTRGALVTGAVMLAVCAALAGALYAWARHQTHVNPLLRDVLYVQENRIALANGCDGLGGRVTRPPPIQDCGIGLATGRPLVVVWGDSHAAHIIPGLTDIAARSGIGLLPRVKMGCRYLLPSSGWYQDAQVRKDALCAEFTQSVLDEMPMLQASQGLTGVVLVARWSATDAWDKALRNHVKRLHAQGLRVLIVGDIPLYPVSVPLCAARNGVAACSALQATVAKDRAREMAILEGIARDIPGVAIWDASEILCRTGRCQIAAGGQLLYSDSNHLSHAGSAYLGAFARPALEWAAGRDVAAPKSDALAAPANRSY